MSCEDEHHHSHGSHGNNNHDHDHSHVAPIPTSSSQTLNSKIDTFKVSALNMANAPGELAKVFKTPDKKYEIRPVIKSDCDEQLIINIPFLNGSAKLYSLILRTNGNSYCPKTIKLFKNDKMIDFDNVELKKPVQTITHPRVGVADDVDETEVIVESDNDFVEHFLQRHKFTGVQQLTVFISDIYDESEDQCRIHSIELRGEFTELNKDPVITIYESAANPADHKNLTAAEHQNNIQFGS
ncbi:hypothetical protein CORT_0A11160 [Candida orthopsilosis Co 90-125]|uniref:PITH domain-containing protein n=1 Tax=Candida orthopsilosis (strain 90-125) TaxID=1136231 RepID=H8WXJ5_CANO9|nr:hypothetical protein CORT_0A11160 [Candida orthopsilosis Co 90-125]CCG21501.1 hypothetical protein CORT_0A11160 [Candida orthopsilosis Co 90-125]